MTQRRMIRSLFLLAAFAIPGGAAPAYSMNLLANPGFEELQGGRPARWEVYLREQAGALGRLDDTAHTGRHAVMLHTPMPYEKDPCNNWSQNVIGEFAEKKLLLTGWIRVENASEAEIWTQCWRKTPLQVLHVASTRFETPVYGTRGWEEVRAAFEVPAKTDFLTVRCVLKGAGTAWFDDIALRAAPEEAAEPEKNAADTKAADAEETGNGEALREIDSLARDVARLQEANLLLAEALEETRADNRALLRELAALRRQLEELRELVAGREKPAPETGPDQKPAPPLVPHGADWKEVP
jgi:hypothetical protein